MTSEELIENFKQGVTKELQSTIKKIRGQVFESSGQINCLFYIKTTAANTNWGITKNVIDKLKNQDQPWFVLLLSSRPRFNYVLSKYNVDYYIKNVWTLNNDGDYKTSPTFPTEYSFSSLQQLKSKMEFPNLNL